MKLLLVEDNEEIVAFLKKGFQFENFLVDVALDGVIGLEKSLSNCYDIIIIDLLLPKMDGMEMLRVMREKGIKTPSIILTAIQDSDSKTKLLNIGADDYLQKPFSFVELLARINAILRRSKNIQHQEIYKVEDMVVNTLTKQVTRNGKVIKLRRKEFALLTYLLAHQGEVINQAMILEEVWDFNSNAFSNTVGTHISSLRQKIDKGFKHKLIQTVHGIGYRIGETKPQEV